MPAVILTAEIVLDPIFCQRDMLLGRFVRMWTVALIERNPVAVEFHRGLPEFAAAVEKGWIVEDVEEGDGFGAGSRHRLTGPQRDPRWLLDRDERNHQGQRTYAIVAIGQRLVKIGRAVDVKARLSKLQTGSAHQLEILGVVNRDIEAALHSKLAAYRERGEWFKLTPQSLSVLRAAGILGGI